MATIVERKTNGKRYILLGSGFGAYQSKKPNWFFGDYVADTDEGQYAMVCVCNAEGRVGWFESSEVEVVSVDGQNVKSIFEAISDQLESTTPPEASRALPRGERSLILGETEKETQPDQS